MFPTTRYGRFLVRQSRYRRRYERWRKNRRRIEYLSLHGHVVYRRSKGWDSVPGTLGKQTSYGLKKTPRHGPILTVAFPRAIVLTAAHHGKPPHAKLIDVTTGALWFGALHPQKKTVGYVRRPSRYFGRKHPRQNGRDRCIRAANLFAQQWRSSTLSPRYPFWDPLHRTPVDTLNPDHDASDFSFWETNPYQ